MFVIRRMPSKTKLFFMCFNRDNLDFPQLRDVHAAHWNLLCGQATRTQMVCHVCVLHIHYFSATLTV